MTAPRTPAQRERRNECAMVRRHAKIDPRSETLLRLLKKYRALGMGAMFPIAIHWGVLGTKPTGNTIAALELRGLVAKVPVLLDGVQITTLVVLTPAGDAFAATLPDLEPTMRNFGDDPA